MEELSTGLRDFYYHNASNIMISLQGYPVFRIQIRNLSMFAGLGILMVDRKIISSTRREDAAWILGRMTQI